MIPTYLMPLANHLWQSTFFAATVALLCLALLRQRASVRYWLWLAASVKFLVPLGWLMELGSRMQQAAAPTAGAAGGLTPVASMVRGISEPFTLAVTAPLLENVPAPPSVVPMALLAIWICGFAASVAGWLRAWLRMRAAVRCASPIRAGAAAGFEGVRVLGSPSELEPCVFGVFRPVLLVPEGMGAHLTGEQLETILLHELCHVRRRDNLTAALHMLAEAVFWFYPPLYGIGGRLQMERETACDEEVLRVLPRPEIYAQGILAVCKFAVQAAPACAAGVAGPDLKRRIITIVARRAVRRMDFARKALVAAALGAATMGPFWAGVTFIRASRAQSQPNGAAGSTAPFAAAAIKPNHSSALNSGFRRFTGGGLNAVNISLKSLIAFAYDIPQDRIVGGPRWLDGDRYDILAKPDEESGQPVDRSMRAIRLRTQALLADRFQLALHKDTREMPIFKLVADKGGPKHLAAPAGESADLVSNGHHVTCTSVSMEFFAKNFLTGEVHAPVVDQTGIQGVFDFSMDWAPDMVAPRRTADGQPAVAPDPTGPSLFSALREQLGLKLEPGKGPVEVLVVDRAEKASGN
jgi:bla regulator protein blaR1